MDKIKYTLLAQESPTRFNGNFCIRVLFSLTSGITLGFLFSFLLIYNDNVNLRTNFIDEKYDESTDINLKTGNLADFLYNEVRILCIIMADKDQIEYRTQYLKETWVKKCNKVIYIGSEKNPLIPEMLIMPGDDSVNNTYARLRESLKFAYKHYLNDFDFFLKANDDSYYVMENLRYFLYQYSSDWPMFIGQRYFEAGYLIGSYILTKRTLIRLVEEGLSNPAICNPGPDGPSDILLADCMKNLNVLIFDANKDKGRFFFEAPEMALAPTHEGDADRWYWHKMKQGIDRCCSDYPIYFHHYWYVHYLYLDYLIYKVHAFGIIKNPEVLPPKLDLEFVINTM